jgi:hypothetical protein
MALSCHCAAPKVPSRLTSCKPVFSTNFNEKFPILPLLCPSEVKTAFYRWTNQQHSCARNMPAFQRPETCRDILNGPQIGVSMLDPTI